MATSVPTNDTTITLDTKSISINESIAPVIFLLVFGVLGNTIAITVLCRTAKSHKWKPFYRFVCGLAITDGGGILFSSPLALVRYSSNFIYIFPKSMCDYLAFVLMFTLMSSAMIVCCMSLDRFVATYFPFTYKSSNQGKRANATLATVWLLAAVVSSLHFFGLGSIRNLYPGSWCFLDFITKTNLNIAYAFIYSIIGILIVILTVFFNLLVILFFIKHMFSERKMKQKKDLHIIAFLLVIVAVFTSCWAPLMVIIIQHASSFINETKESSQEISLFRMGILNSVIDPWVYILFRRKVISLFLRCFNRKTDHDYDINTTDKDVTNSLELSELKDRVKVPKK